jgi:tripartite-type tricarboxylate transporter receptor subunit TctC
VAAPNRLPKEHVAKLAQLLTDIVRRPDVRDRIVAHGWQVAGTSPEGLANRIRKDTATMTEVIERTGVAKR